MHERDFSKFSCLRRFLYSFVASIFLFSVPSHIAEAAIGPLESFERSQQGEALVYAIFVSFSMIFNSVEFDTAKVWTFGNFSVDPAACFDLLSSRNFFK